MVKFCQSHHHHILLCLLRAQLNLRNLYKVIFFFLIAVLITPCSWSEPCALPHHSTCYKWLPWGERTGNGRIFHQVISTIKTYIAISTYIYIHTYVHIFRCYKSLTGYSMDLRLTHKHESWASFFIAKYLYWENWLNMFCIHADWGYSTAPQSQMILQHTRAVLAKI